MEVQRGSLITYYTGTWGHPQSLRPKTRIVEAYLLFLKGKRQMEKARYFDEY